MNAPRPLARIAASVPEPIRPSSSTVASTAGGALATVGLWLLESYVTGPVPAPVAGAITTLVVIAAGYFFSGGRSLDTI